jgi:hypothetical protein
MQKALFLEKMAADWAELDKETQERADPSRVDSIRKTIEAVMPCILTVDFALQFTSQGQPIPDEAFTLLKQLTHFPEAISNVMHQVPALMINGPFVEQLFSAMGATQIERYIAHSVVMIERSREQSVVVRTTFMVWNVYQEKLPAPLIAIYQQLPILIAKAFLQLPEESANKMLKTVILGMSADNQVIFLEHVDEKRELSFAQLLANGSCAPATYLDQHPAEFSALTLNNHNIQASSARDNDTIKILEGMRVSSMEQSINQMDYENYNKLVTALRVQLNSFSTNEDVPQAFAQLTACFRYAPDDNSLLVPKEKFVNSTSFLVAGFARADRLEDGPWKRFIAVAESQKETVWQ